jgi:hypothetical protein
MHRGFKAFFVTPPPHLHNAGDIEHFLLALLTLDGY